MADESHKQQALASAATSDPTMDIDDDWLQIDDEAKPATTSMVAPKGSAASVLAESPAPTEVDSSLPSEEAFPMEQDFTDLAAGDTPRRPKPPPLPREFPATSSASFDQASGNVPGRPKPPPLPPEFPSTSSASSSTSAGSGVERASQVVARADLENEAMVSQEIDSEWPTDDVGGAAALKQPVIPRAPKIPGPADLPGPLIPELDEEEIKAALALRHSRESGR